MIFRKLGLCVAVLVFGGGGGMVSSSCDGAWPDERPSGAQQRYRRREFLPGKHQAGP